MATSCAHRNTIVLTVATSRPYLRSAEALARSAVAVGFPCVHVALPDSLAGQAKLPLVELCLSGSAGSWLPSQEWCEPGRTDRSGYRQTHIIKTQAIVDILRTGHDVLCLDGDRRFTFNPVPALHATGADIAAMRDEALLNLGLVWLRAGSAQLAMARRVANRSYAAWDQAIFNEEASAAGRLSCCYTNAFIHGCVSLEQAMHDLRRSAHAMAADGEHQGEQAGCTPKAERLHALRPPASGGAAVLFRTWRPHAYNELPMAWRHYSRCSRRACPVLEGACNTSARASVAGRGTAFPQTAMDRWIAMTQLASTPTAEMLDKQHGRGGDLRCTAWPTSGTPSRWSDAQRCLHGNGLHDGYEYVPNAGRGTAQARCKGACACCRRPRRTVASSARRRTEELPFPPSVAFDGGRPGREQTQPWALPSSRLLSSWSPPESSTLGAHSAGGTPRIASGRRPTCTVAGETSASMRGNSDARADHTRSHPSAVQTTERHST